MGQQAQGRLTRITAGFSANGVMQITQLAIRLAEVPILLLLWGAAAYGEWLLIAALPAALSLSDGGISKTAQREMTMRSARGDTTGTQGVFQSSWVMLLMISTAVMIALLLILPRIPLASLLGLATVQATDLTAVLLMLSAQVLIYFQCGLLLGGFASAGRYAVGVLLIALASFLSFVGTMLGASIGGGMFGAALGCLVGQCVGYATMFAIFTRAKLPIRYGLEHVSRTTMKELWAPSIANLAFPLSDALNTHGVRIIVGLFFGPIALAAFSTTRTLCRVALQPVLAIARTLEPELSMAHGDANETDSRQLFLNASHAGFWASLALCVAVAIIGPYFYGAWAGEQLPLDEASLYLLLTASLINALWGIALTVPCSVNKHVSLSFRFLLLYGVGSVVFALVLAHFTRSSWGASLGLLIGDAVALGLVLAMSLRLIRVPLRTWVKEVLSSPASLVRRLSSVITHTLTARRWPAKYSRGQ